MVEIRRYSQSFVKDYFAIARKCYPRHIVFEQDFDIVSEYIRKKDGDELGGFYFALLKEQVVGGCLLSTECNDTKRGHARFKYCHLAAADPSTKDSIIKAMDGKVSRLILDSKCKSAKVEVFLAHSERDFKQDVRLFEKNGYIKEGELADHYRLNEKVTVMGKVF